MKLVATKSFSYNTRRLNPGDIFEAKDPDGRLLVGVLKARKLEDRKEQEIPEPNKELLNKLSNNQKTDTKIPVSFVGEKENDKTEAKPEPKIEEKPQAKPEDKVEEKLQAKKNEEAPVDEKSSSKKTETPAKNESSNFKGRGKN